MFLAHARGLLKPGYSQGVRSVIRETLMLRQIEQDVEGEVFRTRAVMESNFLQVVQPKHRMHTINSAIGLLHQAGALYRFVPYKKVEAMNARGKEDRELSKSVAVLKILKKSDYFDRMSKFLNAQVT